MPQSGTDRTLSPVDRLCNYFLSYAFMQQAAVVQQRHPEALSIHIVQDHHNDRPNGHVQNGHAPEDGHWHYPLSHLIAIAREHNDSHLIGDHTTSRAFQRMEAPKLVAARDMLMAAPEAERDQESIHFLNNVLERIGQLEVALPKPARKSPHKGNGRAIA